MDPARLALEQAKFKESSLQGRAGQMLQERQESHQYATTLTSLLQNREQIMNDMQVKLQQAKMEGLKITDAREAVNKQYVLLQQNAYLNDRMKNREMDLQKYSIEIEKLHKVMGIQVKMGELHLAAEQLASGNKMQAINSLIKYMGMLSSDAEKAKMLPVLGNFADSLTGLIGLQQQEEERAMSQEAREAQASGAASQARGMELVALAKLLGTLLSTTA